MIGKHIPEVGDEVRFRNKALREAARMHPGTDAMRRALQRAGKTMKVQAVQYIPKLGCGYDCPGWNIWVEPESFCQITNEGIMTTREHPWTQLKEPWFTVAS
jgi:hypothetical protein